jgi:hypothetical protein
MRVSRALSIRLSVKRHDVAFAGRSTAARALQPLAPAAGRASFPLPHAKVFFHKIDAAPATRGLALRVR